MSEIKTTIYCEITILNQKKHKVTVLSGRYGSFVEAYAMAAKSGYKLISYKQIM